MLSVMEAELSARHWVYSRASVFLHGLVALETTVLPVELHPVKICKAGIFRTRWQHTVCTVLEGRGAEAGKQIEGNNPGEYGSCLIAAIHLQV